MKTGLVVVPLSPLLRSEGLLHLLRDSGAAAVVAAPRMAPELDAIRDQLPVAADRYLATGDAPGYRPLEELTAQASDEQPPDAGLHRRRPVQRDLQLGHDRRPEGHRPHARDPRGVRHRLRELVPHPPRQRRAARGLARLQRLVRDADAGALPGLHVRPDGGVRPARDARRARRRACHARDDGAVAARRAPPARRLRRGAPPPRSR